MFDKVSGELIYPEEYLHGVSHQVYEDLIQDQHDEHGNIVPGLKTRSEFLSFVSDPSNLAPIAEGIIFAIVQHGAPQTIFAPIVSFNADHNPNSVVQMEFTVEQFLTRVADLYQYNDRTYVKTVSGYTFDITLANDQVMSDLPSAIISVLDELNIQ